MIFSSPVSQKSMHLEPFGLSVHAFCETGDENTIPTCHSAGNYYILTTASIFKKYIIRFHWKCLFQYKKTMRLEIIVIWNILMSFGPSIASKEINSSRDHLKFHLQLYRNHCGDVALCDDVTNHLEPALSAMFLLTKLQEAT